MRRIAIVAFEGCQPLDVVGPHDVFTTANEMRLLARRHPAYDIELIGKERDAIRSEGGLAFLPDRTLEEVGGRGSGDVNTLIVAGGPGARRAATDPKVVGQVRKVAGRAHRVASVCTGAFVLAAAGLLDGRRATTHWEFCAVLAAGHPAVSVQPDPIYVRDGNVWTSAGVTAGIDLALAMVEDDLGREIANAVARSLVVFVRRAGGQSQFSVQLSVQSAERTPIRDVQTWIDDHPGTDLGIPSLARRAGMSPRHFSRLFREQVGVSPAAYVERVRIETARRLLESTDMPIERLATTAGFGTSEAFRRSLTRCVGLSPREYRARFGGSPLVSTS